LSDIFREVDEEVRKDKAQAFAKKHGPWIGGLVVGGLVALGGWQLWQQWQAQERLELAERYRTAMAEAAGGDAVAGLDQLEALASDSEESYGLLAAFQAARLRAEAGDLDGALATWDRLAQDDGLPRAWREAARLLAVQHAIGNRPRGEVDERLAPLLEQDAVYRPAALELAALNALAAEDVEGAREYLQTLSQLSDAPPQLRERAAQLLAAIGS
jgi:hypothetical protein